MDGFLPWRPLIRVSLTTGADAMSRGVGVLWRGGQLGAELYHLFMFPIHWKHVSLSDVQVADWRSDEAQMEQKYFLDLLVDKGNLWNLRMKLDS